MPAATTLLQCFNYFGLHNTQTVEAFSEFVKLFVPLLFDFIAAKHQNDHNDNKSNGWKARYTHYCQCIVWTFAWNKHCVCPLSCFIITHSNMHAVLISENNLTRDQCYESSTTLQPIQCTRPQLFQKQVTENTLSTRWRRWQNTKKTIIIKTAEMIITKKTISV